MDTNTNTKVCRDCGRELPLDSFSNSKKSRTGKQPICKECMSKRLSAAAANRERDKKAPCPEPKGVNPDLAKFMARELLEELRARGYRGTLEYVYTITL